MASFIRARRNCRTLWCRDKQYHPRQRCGERKQRSLILATLGFKSYSDYLKSTLWKHIREAKLAAASNCELCGGSAHIVHHQRYSRAALSGEKTDLLVSLCHRCHKRVEFRSDGTKRTPSAARRFIRKELAKGRESAPTNSLDLAAAERFNGTATDR